MAKKKDKTITITNRLVGNILLLISAAMIMFTYLPVIRLYFFPVSQSVELENVATENFIFIPKIGASAPLIENVNPWDSSNYLPALNQGVAQASGFSTPGNIGLTYLFAHSSDYPWKITQYNTAFFRLNELQKGDIVKIKWHGKILNYQVDSKLEVWPNETDKLISTDLGSQVLVMQTCTPIGTTLKRLLVFSKPV